MRYVMQSIFDCNPSKNLVTHQSCLPHIISLLTQVVLAYGAEGNKHLQIPGQVSGAVKSLPLDCAHLLMSHTLTALHSFPLCSVPSAMNFAWADAVVMTMTDQCAGPTWCFVC